MRKTTTGWAFEFPWAKAIEGGVGKPYTLYWHYYRTRSEMWDELYRLLRRKGETREQLRKRTYRAGGRVVKVGLPMVVDKGNPGG